MNPFKPYLAYIKIGIFIGYSVFLVWSTYQVVTGRIAKKENKVIVAAVKKDNESKKEISTHHEKVEKEEKVATREILLLETPTITFTGKCVYLEGLKDARIRL